VVEFIGKIHDKPVRDVQQSPRGDQLTLTTAWDKQLRISSTGQTRNGILQTFNLPAMGWSCSWHPDNPSLVVAGLSGNRMAVFDVRNATQPTQLINCPSASAVRF
jgi:WD40 repeat protein